MGESDISELLRTPVKFFSLLSVYFYVVFNADFSRFSVIQSGGLSNKVF